MGAVIGESTPVGPHFGVNKRRLTIGIDNPSRILRNRDNDPVGDRGTADKAFGVKKRASIDSDRRTGLSAWRRYSASCLIAMLGVLAPAGVASAETRTLKFYFVHTGEKAEIAYKKNGRYLKGGLNRIDRFLRDWRRNEPTKMDPRLLDLVWEVYRKSGSRKHIHVISAYRSPATNAMLIKRGRAAARNSQHMVGRAMDFYLPDVKLSELRRIGLQMQVGGVGYYPGSGSPFVHMDVGGVRHWPRMRRDELVAIFPNGKTLHVPKDGKPLPGYKQALASYNKRRKSGGGVIVASAEPSKPEKKKSGGFLAAFFGGGRDDGEDRVQAATARVKTVPAPAAVERRPATPETIIAALPARDVPLPLFAPRPEIDAGVADAANIDAPLETEPSGDAVRLALAAPEPTPRPSESLEARIAADEEAPAIVQSAGPDDGKGDRVVEVPPPERRPRLGGETVVVAALSDGGSVLDVGTARFGMTTLGDSGDVTEPGNDRGKADKARSAAVSPKESVVAGIEPINPLETLDPDARTTGKSDRPVAADGRPARRAMIVPPPGKLSRRAFAKTLIARAREDARASSFVFGPVGRAPREVYTVGFSRTPRAGDPYRFTGRAVRFLPIARFD